MGLAVRRWIRAGLALGAALLVGGCSATDRLILTGASRLNMCTEADEPHSLALRVYYLRNQETFLAADFRSLWETDRETLGDDLLDRHVANVTPARQDTLSLSREGAAKGARFVGVAANFCRVGTDCWRKVIEIQGRKTETLLYFGEECID